MHDAMRNGVNLPQPPVLQAGLQHRQRSSVGVCGILRQGHLLRLALGIVVLGSVVTLDTAWTGATAQAVLRCARQLSHDLGHSGSL